MPRHVNTVPKYRKKTVGGNCYAVVDIGGHVHHLGRYNSKASHIEYDRLIAEWLAAGRPSTGAQLNQDIQTTVIELIAAYFKHAQVYYGKSSEQTHGIRRILKLLRQYYGDIPVDEFGPKRLKAIRQMLVARGNGRRYINDNIDRIKRMFKWAVAEELVHPDTYNRLATVAGLRRGRSPAKDAEPIKPVDDDVVDQTLPHLPDTVADMVRIQRLTGARPGEVCIMRPMDIDQAGEVWIYTPSSHKTEHHGKQRHIAIGPRAQEVLTPYLLRDAANCCFSPAESEEKRNTLRRKNRKTPMTPSQQARQLRGGKRKLATHYNKDSYRRAIQRGCDKAGVSHWSPNRLRHTAGTEVRKVFGLEAAQCVLGHSRADVTQIYAERDLQKAREVAKAIG